MNSDLCAHGFDIFISGKTKLNDMPEALYRSDHVPFRLLAGIIYEL